MEASRLPIGATGMQRTTTTTEISEYRQGEWVQVERTVTDERIGHDLDCLARAWDMGALAFSEGHGSSANPFRDVEEPPAEFQDHIVSDTVECWCDPLVVRVPA